MPTRMLTAREHELIEKTLGIEIPDRALPGSAASLHNLHAVAGPFASTMAASDEFQNRKILVIDDEAINVRLIQKCLQIAGYRKVETHTEPESALERIITQQPDLVICDVVMSVSGLQILQPGEHFETTFRMVVS